MNNTNKATGKTAPSSHPSGLPNNYYWFFIIYMAALSAFGSFVNDMYVPSLPAMTHYFHCSVSTVQLGLSLGMLGLGLGQIILGPVSDKYGRKSVLVGSIGLFIVASVISVFSTSIEFFLVCRFFQGLGASGGYFLARTIPADVTGGRTLAKMMAIIGAINGIAPASAPVIGGIVADWKGWQAVFVLLAIIGTLLLLFSFKLKESLPASRRTKGSIWSAFGNYGTLIKSKYFMIHVLLKGATLGLLFAYISSAPFIMHDHYGLSQTLLGIVMGVNALFVVLGSVIALKFKYLKDAATIGGWVLLIAMLCEGASLWFVHSLWLYEICMTAGIFGMGLIFTASNTLAMNEGRIDAGAASALLGLVGYIFGMVASPLVGLGNVLHATAITLVIFAIIIFIMAQISGRLKADLNGQTGE